MDMDGCQKEDGKFRLEDRGADLKKPQIVDSEATQGMSFLGSKIEKT